jgi:hypothetical protein
LGIKHDAPLFSVRPLDHLADPLPVEQVHEARRPPRFLPILEEAKCFGAVTHQHVLPVDEKLEITHGFALSLCTDLFPKSRYVLLYITNADGGPPDPAAGWFT